MAALKRKKIHKLSMENKLTKKSELLTFEVNACMKTDQCQTTPFSGAAQKVAAINVYVQKKSVKIVFETCLLPDMADIKKRKFSKNTADD